VTSAYSATWRSVKEICSSVNFDSFLVLISRQTALKQTQSAITLN
jgi:hypothetical protein